MKRVFLKVFACIMALCSVGVFLVTPLVSQAATAEELRSAVVSVAVAENGYRPARDNQTKYGAWYGWQGPWCTMFALWCINQASVNMGVSMGGVISPTGGSTEDMLSWFRQHDSYQSCGTGFTPRAGDWIFFRAHVGLVESVMGGNITTIEGNISRPDGVSVVARRNYSVGNGTIIGYGVPKYEKLANKVPVPPPVVVADTSIEPFQGMVNTQLLNVRSAPKLAAAQLAQLPYGAVCTVTATNGEWYKISGSANGYVRSAYVTAYVPAPPSPTMDVVRVAEIIPEQAQAVQAEVQTAVVVEEVTQAEAKMEIEPVAVIEATEKVTLATAGDCTADSIVTKDVARTLELEQERCNRKEALKPKLVSLGMSGVGMIGMATVFPILKKRMDDTGMLEAVPDDDEEA